MCRGEATLTDAVVAITIMESSMAGASLLGGTSPLHSCFPADPEAEYRRQESLVLERLGLMELRRGSGGALGHNAFPAGAALNDNGMGSTAAAAAAATVMQNDNYVEQPGHVGHVLLSQRAANLQPALRFVWV